MRSLQAALHAQDSDIHTPTWRQQNRHLTLLPTASSAVAHGVKFALLCLLHSCYGRGHPQLVILTIASTAVLASRLQGAAHQYLLTELSKLEATVKALC